MTVLGAGDYRYELLEKWGDLPDGWSFGKVAAVAVDRQDNVYVFCRSEHPLIVYSTKELANTQDITVRSEAMLKAQLLFESVVRAITDALGVAPGLFRPTMDTIEVVGM